MKKIITLLFFAGFLTASFAQPGNRGQNDEGNGDNYQSSPRQVNNNYVNAHQSYNNEGFRNGKENNQYNDYGRHNRNNWSNRDGYGWDRYDHPRYNEERIFRDHSYSRRDRSWFFFRRFHGHGRY